MKKTKEKFNVEFIPNTEEPRVPTNQDEIIVPLSVVENFTKKREIKEELNTLERALDKLKKLF